MPSRRLLSAALSAAAVVSLAACKAGDTSASAPVAPASSAPAPSAPASSAPASSASDDPADGPSIDPEPTFDCSTPDLPAGQQVVQITAAPSGATLQAKQAVFGCDPNGGGYAGTGAAKQYAVADGASAELSTGSTEHRTVPLAELYRHIGDCLGGNPVHPPYFCTGEIYKLSLDASGRVTGISQVWHP